MLMFDVQLSSNNKMGLNRVLSHVILSNPENESTYITSLGEVLQLIKNKENLKKRSLIFHN